MRVNLVRYFACLLGLSMVSPTFADYGQSANGGYMPPGKWSNFNVPDTSPALATPPKSAPATPNRFVSDLRPIQPQPARAAYASTTPNDIRQVLPAARPAASVQAVGCNGNCGSNHHQAMGEYNQVAPEAVYAPQPHSAPAGPYDGYSVYSAATPQPYASALSEAVAAPWTDCDPAPALACAPPTRLPLSPWFGGGGVLLWNMSNNNYQRFVFSDGSTNVVSSTNQVDPGFAAGYDVFVGRYLGCGRYGLGVGYFNFNPSSEQNTSTSSATAGVSNDDYRAAMPQWNNLQLDHDANVATSDNVYDIYDDSAAMQVTRNVGFQGIEANLYCFGSLGARRITAPCGCGLGKGPLCKLKHAMGYCCGSGYTGFPGLLTDPCDSRVQVINSQGFRWFQFKDTLQFTQSDAYDGYTGPTDVTYTSRATNDLYGYQFGSRLYYCLGPRLSMNVGGKGGIYANDVFVEQRLGTPSTAAYLTGLPTQQIDYSKHNTVLAGLGEANLGLGYRINNAWSLNGGYRMLYASGVATSISAMPNDYFAINQSSANYANSSVLLHGAYIGALFNW